MDAVTEWLIGADPWVEYRTRLDLLGQREGDKDVVVAARRMISHPQIKRLISELKEWPGAAFSSHKSAGLMMHKLSFLAETGIKADNADIKNIIQKIHEHTDGGVPQAKGNIPKHYGGTGEDIFGWSLCDAPNVLYSLLCFDKNDETARRGLDKLKALARVNGWPCAVSPELGNFRGPGRKEDPCPYATLIMLKALSAAEDTDCTEARQGVYSLLDLWENSRERHPYIFYMGTDFRKLKAPFVWYDILHVADVIARFEWAREDARLAEMASVIKSKEIAGVYTPESVWQTWKDFDFGQKKQPSAWLTYLAMRILNRVSVDGH